jgi:hypothetical protein
MTSDLSNEIRKDTVSMVGLTQARPSDVVEPFFSLSIAGAISDVTGSLELGPTYQETNALIGSCLVGDDYTAVDAETLDAGLASDGSSFNVVSDGKASDQGLSMVTVFGSWLVWIIAITLVIVSAVIVVVLLGRRHKRNKKRSTKK